MNNPFTEKMLESMNKLANHFATERVDQVMTELENKMKTMEGRVVYNKDTLKGVIGRMLATAYIKGYADKAEGIQPKSLFLPTRIK